MVHAVAQLAHQLSSAPSRNHRPIPVGGDPRLRAALRFTEAMAKTAPTRPRQVAGFPVGSIAYHLKTAAVSVRAATDLLATHIAVRGEWRTPDSAELDDTSVRLAALGDVARLATDLAKVCPLLIRTARQAGAPAAWLKGNNLAALAAARETADDLRSLLPPGDGSAIATLTVANPGIRVGEPLTEMVDRVARMQVTAWRAAHHPDRESGVPLLLDFATAAVTLHTSAMLTSARSAGVRLRDPRAPHHVKALLARAERWRALRAQLIVLTSTCLQNPTLTEDVTALRDLLAGLTSPHTGSQNPDRPRPAPTTEPARLAAALTEMAGTFDDIAHWNSITLTNLATAELLSVPSRVLARNMMPTAPEQHSNPLIGRPAHPSRG
jgi:hypothetical protein